MARERHRPGGDDLQPKSDRPELRLLRAGLRSLSEAGLRAPEATRLRALHLHGNSLATLHGLDAVCPALEELVVSSNDLRALQGVGDLQQLRLLDISCNCLKNLEGVGSLRLLEVLRAAYNQISSMRELLPLRGPASRLRSLDLRDNAIKHLGELVFLGGLQNLEDLRLQAAGGRRGNPVCRLPGYRPAVLRAVPDLEQLDEEGVGAAERLGGLEQLVLPENWPPAPAEPLLEVLPNDETAALSAESKEASSLTDLQAALAQKKQAAAEARARTRSAEESLAALQAKASPAAPKISRQMQQELRIVAGEAKRRQVMNAELTKKLGETLREMHVEQASARQMGDGVYEVRRACTTVREQRFKAAAEIQSYGTAAEVAARRQEESAAQLTQDTAVADKLLMELTSETEALAAASADFRRRAASAADRRLATLGHEEEICSLQTYARKEEEELARQEEDSEEQAARCRAEGATRDALRRLQEDAEADAASVLDREEVVLAQHRAAAEAAEVAAFAAEARAAQSRRELEVENAAEVAELQALEDRTKARQVEEAASAAAAEQSFALRKRSATAEARQLKGELETTLAIAEEEEKALRRQRGRAEACQLSVSTRSETLASERSVAAASQEALSLAEETLSQTRAELGVVEARKLALERKRDIAQVELKDLHVDPNLHEASKEEFAAMMSEQSKLKAVLSAKREEETQAASALSSAETPERLREELIQQEADEAALTAEFHDADQQMDLLAGALQQLQEEASAREAARTKRQADWRKAEAEVLDRLEDASAKEEAAQDMAEAVREEVDKLNQESEQFDEDFAWLESRVDEARQQWSLADEAEAAELAAVEARSLRSAEEAEHQLASLGKALSRELSKKSEVNRKIEMELEHEEQLLQGYQREESAVQEAWNVERKALAEEAASVASELQRLAQGMS